MTLEDAAKEAAGNWQKFESLRGSGMRRLMTPITGRSSTRTIGTADFLTRATPTPSPKRWSRSPSETTPMW